MIVRKLRLQRGWSQEHLAQLSGLNIRTIQRIERGQGAGLESMKALAAVFEVSFSDLQTQDEPMNSKSSNTYATDDERQAIEYVRDIKGFYTHALTYMVLITGLILLNAFISPGRWWVLFAAIGWGIGLLVHALNVFEVFDFFGPEWEKKQVEKRLGRKL
jgi:transcriptional regulator with XRE-family HTH domain